jgi:hypothetical protein
MAELPRDDGLIQELCNLEARPTVGGFTRIAAAGRGHDDRAVAVAATVAQLLGRVGISAEEAKILQQLNAGLGEPQVPGRAMGYGGRGQHVRWEEGLQ